MMNDPISRTPNLINYLYFLMSQIPKGKVTTFRLLSEALGSKYSIKFILNYYKNHKNWYRIVNEKGEIHNFIQKELLKKEGIQIRDNKIVNLNEYIFYNFKTSKPLKLLREYQKRLKDKIVLYDDFGKLELIGGVDLSYRNNKAFVVYVLLDKKLNLIDTYVFEEKINFPYIPTFLAFREGEPIIKTFDKIDKPDILFVNGQGIAHPANMGLAAYIGAVLDIPTIGVTKKHLFGVIEDNKIFIENKQVGWVINKFNKRIYTSPGNKVSIETSKVLVEKFWIKGKYPEPIRLADEISKKVKRTKK